MKEYHKIHSLYKRDEQTNRFLQNQWSKPEFDYLQNNIWTFDEKIDGTNIRVSWIDGVVEFRGRTNNASIPAPLIHRLMELFPKEKFEEAFFGVMDSKAVILYGEGYGAKIQKGAAYSDKQDFILFDVQVGNWWLARADVELIAVKMGLDTTPILGEGTIHQAIEKVAIGFKSKFGTADAEGLVLRPKTVLFNNKGERIITKIKTRDFTWTNISRTPSPVTNGIQRSNATAI
jgi:ATP-dependent RNA circularization protein (DNA/RNA ligase family)